MNTTELLEKIEVLFEEFKAEHAKSSKAAHGRARKTLGDQAATVFGEQNIFLIPAAAALRSIEPTLPGSCN